MIAVKKDTLTIDRFTLPFWPIGRHLQTREKGTMAGVARDYTWAGLQAHPCPKERSD